MPLASSHVEVKFVGTAEEIAIILQRITQGEPKPEPEAFAYTNKPEQLAPPAVIERPVYAAPALKEKRHRRTKAEMEAARSLEAKARIPEAKASPKKEPEKDLAEDDDTLSDYAEPKPVTKLVKKEARPEPAPAPEPVKKLTQEAVNLAVREYIARQGGDTQGYKAAVTILNRFGVTKPAQLTPDQYEEVYKAFTE